MYSSDLASEDPAPESCCSFTWMNARGGDVPMPQPESGPGDLQPKAEPKAHIVNLHEHKGLIKAAEKLKRYLIENFSKN